MTFLFGFLALLLAIGLSIAGMMIVRRRFDLSELRLNHDVADPLLSVVGTLFSILLGFLVAGAMQRFDEARIHVQEEAGAIADVFRSAGGFPEPLQTQLQHKCLSYVDCLIDEEWKLMEAKKASPRAWSLYGELWTASVNLQPKSEGESNVHQAILSAVSKVGNYRTLRLAAMSNQLPLGMWIVVLVGGGATIAFTYFFEVRSERTQIIMTTLVATVMGLNIFLLANYDYPFSGDIAVSPTAMELDRQIFNGYLKRSSY